MRKVLGRIGLYLFWTLPSLAIYLTVLCRMLGVKIEVLRSGEKKEKSLRQPNK